MSAAIDCPSCGATVAVVALFSRMGGFYPDTQVGSVACPSCAKWLDFRVSDGSLELGWTYWAGSLHFEGLTRASVAGLRAVGEGEDRAIELEGVAYRAMR